jgi:N-acetylmuramoyl-L-alanine amidase
MARVWLAVGHGIRPNGTYDPGAVSADGRWDEQRAGDVIVREVARRLVALGVKVWDESFSDTDPNYVGTARSANDWHADYVVSIHHDWSLAPLGAFGHWYTNEGKALADDIQAAVGQAGFELRPSWHKMRTDLYLLKHTNAPSVIYECSRIGEPALDTEAELQRMGQAIAAGIAKHLGITEEEDMTEEDRRLLKQNRVSAVAQSYELKWLRGKLNGWAQDELDQVDADKAAAVADEKERLGL